MEETCSLICCIMQLNETAQNHQRTGTKLIPSNKGKKYMIHMMFFHVLPLVVIIECLRARFTLLPTINNVLKHLSDICAIIAVAILRLP